MLKYTEHFTEEELIDFVGKEKKVMERALNEQSVYEIFRKDKEDILEEALAGNNAVKQKKKMIKSKAIKKVIFCLN